METDRRIRALFQLRCLNNMISRTSPKMPKYPGLDNGTVKNQDTHLHGMIIGYLCKNEGKSVFQSDVEKAFDVRRSTISRVLQLMEKNGLIKRVPSEEDKRKKEIKITKVASQKYNQLRSQLEGVGDILLKDISEVELDIFQEVMEKMLANLKESQDEKGKKGNN